MRQGGHQVAQKSMNTTFPLREARETVSPVRDLRAKAGAAPGAVGVASVGAAAGARSAADGRQAANSRAAAQNAGPRRTDRRGKGTGAYFNSASSFSLMSFLEWTPTICSTTWPPLKSNMVGMAEML